MSSKVVRLDLVGRSLDDAVEAPELPGEDGPPRAGDRQGGGGGGGAPKTILPEGCPVEPLGISGDVCYYLDASRQFRAMAAKEHGRLPLVNLFGDKGGWLYETWPRMDKDGNVTGWRPEKAAEKLMAACARKGPWSALDHVHGAGAWRGPEGELVLHSGDIIIIIMRNGERRQLPPGMIGRDVYPAAAPLPRPLANEQFSPVGAAVELLDLLGSWSWKRGQLDARLLLGWIGAAMIGGALIWRPACWLTGGRGTGKSTLHQVLRDVFDGGILQVADATAAGIWQSLGHATLPVAFDELESEEDRRRSDAVLKLARLAASGGMMRRGGNDHNATAFVVRSCFLFSSILIPPMLGAERSRIAILELDPLPTGRPAPGLEPERLRLIGQALRERLSRGWGRLDDLILTYRAGLAERGQGARACDQFGTLLAIADVLLNDTDPDGDSLDEILEPFSVGSLAETATDVSDPERCLGFLLSSIIDPYRSGGRQTIGEWVAKAIRTVDWDDAERDAVTDARRVLTTFGLKVMDEAEGNRWLAVANTHEGLASIYRGSHWAGRSGSDGVWAQDLKRLEGAMAAPQTVYFAGARSRAVLVPLSWVRDGDGEN